VLAHLGLWWLRWEGVGSVGVCALAGETLLSWVFGSSDGKVLAQLGLWWLSWGDVPQLGMWRQSDSPDRSRCEV
jgi:hypothetical protein